MLRCEFSMSLCGVGGRVSARLGHVLRLATALATSMPTEAPRA